MPIPFLRLVLGTAVLLAGCATTANYVYVPRGASFWREGYPTEVTEVGQGKVLVTSFGITELVPESTAVATVHVRLSIANDDTSSWTVTTASQMLELSGVQAGPVFVKSDVPTTPTIAIPPHQTRVIDLYFRLPAGVREESELAAFDFVWQVSTPVKQLSARTHFQRVDEERTQPYSHVTFHSGVPYWFQPARPMLRP